MQQLTFSSSSGARRQKATVPKLTALPAPTTIVVSRDATQLYLPPSSFKIQIYKDMKNVVGRVGMSLQEQSAGVGMFVEILRVLVVVWDIAKDVDGLDCPRKWLKSPP